MKKKIIFVEKQNKHIPAEQPRVDDRRKQLRHGFFFNILKFVTTRAKTNCPKIIELIFGNAVIFLTFWNEKNKMKSQISILLDVEHAARRPLCSDVSQLSSVLWGGKETTTLSYF